MSPELWRLHNLFADGGVLMNYDLFLAIREVLDDQEARIRELERLQPSGAEEILAEIDAEHEASYGDRPEE